MSNKIRYGLSNVYWAKATISTSDGSATYATPVAWPGAVNLSLDAEGEISNFHADNIVYYTSVANNGYSGTLESALVPDDFREEILGEYKDTKGVMVEKSVVDPVHFALLFQFEGDKKAIRHALYNVIASRPSTEGATKEDAIEPQTESIDITVLPIYNSALGENVVKARTAASTNATAYSNWYAAVYTVTTTT